jgi:hypothetical protein
MKPDKKPKNPLKKYSPAGAFFTKKRSPSPVKLIFPKPRRPSEISSYNEIFHPMTPYPRKDVRKSRKKVKKSKKRL